MPDSPSWRLYRAEAGSRPIRTLVGPLAFRRRENRQFFHHELGFADRPDHMRAGGSIPSSRHAFPSVAAPAFDISAAGKIASVDPGQILFVQPRFAGAID